MTAPTVLGIDPGGATTGVVTRRGDELLGAALVKRRKGEPMEYYADQVTYAIWASPIDHNNENVVAIEDLNDPSPHMGVTSVRGLLDTSWLIGWVACWLAEMDLFRVVMVPPGGHGSGPLRAYPPELVGSREKTGTGKRRHLRSAWSIAAAGATLVRLDEARSGPNV